MTSGHPTPGASSGRPTPRRLGRGRLTLDELFARTGAVLDVRADAPRVRINEVTQFAPFFLRHKQ